ncbi:MAG: GtrA family protein [bacterium]
MTFLVQLKKYLTVGLGSAITDFSVYGLLLHFAGLSPEMANLISRPCGGVFSFIGNKLWTFDRRHLSGTRREFIRFWIVWLVSYGVSELLVWTFHLYFMRNSQTPLAMADMIRHITGIRPDMVKILPKFCAECLVGVGLFLSHRAWTFRHH